MTTVQLDHDDVIKLVAKIADGLNVEAVVMTDWQLAAEAKQEADPTKSNVEFGSSAWFAGIPEEKF